MRRARRARRRGRADPRRPELSRNAPLQGRPCRVFSGALTMAEHTTLSVTPVRRQAMSDCARCGLENEPGPWVTEDKCCECMHCCGCGKPCGPDEIECSRSDDHAARHGDLWWCAECYPAAEEEPTDTARAPEGGPACAGRHDEQARAGEATNRRRRAEAVAAIRDMLEALAVGDADTPPTQAARAYIERWGSFEPGDQLAILAAFEALFKLHRAVQFEHAHYRSLVRTMASNVQRALEPLKQ